MSENQFFVFISPRRDDHGEEVRGPFETKSKAEEIADSFSDPYTFVSVIRGKEAATEHHGELL